MICGSEPYGKSAAITYKVLDGTKRCDSGTKKNLETREKIEGERAIKLFLPPSSVVQPAPDFDSLIKEKRTAWKPAMNTLRSAFWRNLQKWIFLQ